jgi:integrase
MASIYRPTYTRPIPAGAEIITRKGQCLARWKDERGRTQTAPLTEDGTKVRREYRCYYVDYTLPNGERQTVKGYTDQKATEQLAARLEREAAQGNEGLADPRAESRKRPLADHLANFRAHLEAKNNAPRYVQQVVAHCQAAFDGTEAKLFADLKDTTVETWLAEQRRAGLSPRTSDAYLTSVKSFARWLAKSLRVESPLADVKKLNDKADVRRKRRPLSADEAGLFLASVRMSDRDFRGLTGEDRHFLYAVAFQTGLRASELANAVCNFFSGLAAPGVMATLPRPYPAPWTEK